VRVQACARARGWQSFPNLRGGWHWCSLAELCSTKIQNKTTTDVLLPIAKLNNGEDRKTCERRGKHWKLILHKIHSQQRPRVMVRIFGYFWKNFLSFPDRLNQNLPLYKHDFIKHKIFRSILLSKVPPKMLL
jgi:hypothetical protein